MSARRQPAVRTADVRPGSSPEPPAASPQLLREILDATSARRRIDGVVIGVFTGLDCRGAPLVSYPDMPAPRPMPARAAVALDAGAAGRPVALLFEGGDPHRPLVMGLLHQPAAPGGAVALPGGREVEVDGRKVTISASQEIVLRCGKASIVLTAAGKILIQGAYLSSRSSGAHRIKGASVQIN